MMKVTITFDGEEYRVPGPKRTEAQAYYTDSRADAVGTARIIFGFDAAVRFKRVECHAQ